MNTVRFLLPYLKVHWPGFVFGLLLVPPSTLAALGVPYLTGEAVRILESARSDSTLSGTSTSSLLTNTVLWILGFGLVRSLTLFGVRLLVINASRRIEFDLRNLLFAHLQALDPGRLRRTPTGDVMARFTSDVESVRTIAGPVVMYTSQTLTMLAVALPLMLSVSWSLTLCIMVPMCLLSVAVRWIGPRVHDAYFKSQEALSALSTVSQENFAGIRVVKSFVEEEPETRRFEAASRKFADRNLFAARVSAWMYPFIGGVNDLSLMALLVVGGLLLLWGGIDLSDVIKVSGYQALLLWPMISLGWVVNQFQRGGASIRRLESFLEIEPAVSDTARLAEPAQPRIAGALSIRGLSFGHERATILRNVSIEAPAGSTIAIVGRTGSGKSTLVQLIPRLLPVPPGTIFLDSTDIDELPLGLLRGSIGFVPQDSFLFSKSVFENIAFDREEATRDDVLEAARITRLDKDLDQFPRGWDEIVGERGITLSGGQRQRASIARAILLRPRILILDDALSAVDTGTEEEILENLKRATTGMTTIIVSHRISSVKHADRIYVLEAGAIAEEGTHADLLRARGLYADIHRRQLLADELERM